LKFLPGDLAKDRKLSNVSAVRRVRLQR